ncbi:PhzF family phenazine biosynthesis protein [Streptomyces bingchenggensis BCW-1]|uniref:PhzF family phenazine biosynthesis protein n=1 Tax=Streptomyces bingchenggensis (strain BCW-1) TaxID=749414 RepID=D7CE61_STRBB|nr:MULTISPECIES: PhzF family phenazine biosynthesis isomerase [Streptomyces]ADI06748.1 PhzF family phenazine biosynthesis protein [Streptomyces bingchenggensis BCW-1]
MFPEVHFVTVFADGPGGGNPAPIVVDAATMTDEEMRDVARRSGHESGFVLPAPVGSGCDLALRFWVPNHEMSMCGHVTVGALWLLDRLGRLPGDEVRVFTPSGIVLGWLGGPVGRRTVEISQPLGAVEPLADVRVEFLLDVLGITRDDLAPAPVQNASTSRVKTLLPLASPALLDALRPDFDRVEEACTLVDSTGLYPYAVGDPGRPVFDARQFPRSSGYPEDAATGIAATALVAGLLAAGRVAPNAGAVHVRQGRAMGRPSRIDVRFARDGDAVTGLRLGGAVALADGAERSTR